MKKPKKVQSNLNSNPLLNLINKARKMHDNPESRRLYFLSKRQKVKQPLRKEVEKLIRTNLTKELFQSLPGAGRYLPHFQVIKVLDLGKLDSKLAGTKVVIKDTSLRRKGKFHEHGQHPGWLREDILKHHQAVRAGIIDSKGYILRTPKFYFKEGPFVVMEYIDNVPDHNKLTKEDHAAWINAAKKVEINFEILTGKKILNETDKKPPHPQVFPRNLNDPKQLHSESKKDPHVMFRGYSKSGKVILYTPYDYS